MTNDHSSPPCVSQRAPALDDHALTDLFTVLAAVLARSEEAHLERITKLLALFQCEIRCRLFLLIYTEAGCLCVDELAQRVNRKSETVSYHLNWFKELGLISVVRQGCYHYYRLTDEVQAMLEGLNSVTQQGSNVPFCQGE